jgi:peptidoglycan/LPS O-acetylase OafA/YrhL
MTDGGTTVIASTAMQPHGPKARLGHRPSLDGVRGVAIACVVLNHTVGYPAMGFTGVDLFFVLSGFLITTLLLEEYAQNGQVSLGNFYRRRALRLLPALVAFLAVFLVYASVRGLVRGGTFDQALFGVAAGLGYFTNIAMGIEPSTIPYELRHLWSLAIEEQFYIVWPPLLFFVLRGRKRLALGVLALAVVFSVLQQIRLVHDGAISQRIVFGTDTRISSIAFGCMVALALALSSSARGRVESFARTVMPLTLACFLSLLLIHPRVSLFSAWVLLFGASCALLIVVALDSRSRLARVLSVSPLTFLGRISYSLYLWHVAIFWAFGLHTVPELRDVPALALSLACALASYYLVEMPFLRRKLRLRSSPEPELRIPALPALSPAAP